MKKIVTPAKIFKLIQKSKKLKQKAKNAKLDEICKFCQKIGPKKAIFGHFSQNMIFQNLQALVKIMKKIVTPAKNFQNWFKKWKN